MKYIDMHAHMVSRTTDDYRQMALTGCLAVTEPAFWAGYDRRSADVFADYFDHLTTFEPARAAEYGIKHHCWLCLNPKEGEDRALAKQVLAIIPEFLGRETVLGIGEIGLNRVTRNELATFKDHVELALEHDQLIHIHTPHLACVAPGLAPMSALGVRPTAAASGAAARGRTGVCQRRQRSSPCPCRAGPGDNPLMLRRGSARMAHAELAI